jgi:glycosyltransferase involved in cell wall biosynthesis
MVIINDGSTDSTRDIIWSYERRVKNIRVFDQDNEGIVNALNRGLSLCRGKYIARMDADDISLPARFERQIQCFKKNNDMAVCGSAGRLINADGQVIGLPIVWPLSYRSVHRWLQNRGTCMFHSSAMIRRNCLEKVGGYRPALYGAEDYDLWFRLSERYKIVNLPRILLLYRIHRNSVSVRAAEKQALADLSARKSAALRCRGMKDPLDDTEHINENIIEALGITPEHRRYLSSKVAVQAARRMTQERVSLHDLEKFINRIDTGNDRKDFESEIKADLILLRCGIIIKHQSRLSACGYILHQVMIHPNICKYLLIRGAQRFQRLRRIVMGAFQSLTWL